MCEKLTVKLSICLAGLNFWLRKKIGNTKDYSVIAEVLENELVSKVRQRLLAGGIWGSVWRHFCLNCWWMARVLLASGGSRLGEPLNILRAQDTHDYPVPCV